MSQINYRVIDKFLYKIIVLAMISKFIEVERKNSVGRLKTFLRFLGMIFVIEFIVMID